jgi:hypothetical protein
MSAAMMKKADVKLQEYNGLLYNVDLTDDMLDMYTLGSNTPETYLLTLDDVKKIANKTLKQLIVAVPQDYDSAHILNHKSEEIVEEYFFGDGEYAYTGGGSDVWIVITPAFLKWLNGQTAKLKLKLKKLALKKLASPLSNKKHSVTYHPVKTTAPTLNANISVADLKKTVKENLKIHAKAFAAVTTMSGNNIPDAFYISSIPHSYALKISNVNKINSEKVIEYIVIEPSDYDYISVLNKCSEALIDNHFNVIEKNVVTTGSNANIWILVTPKMLLWLEKLIVKMEKWITVHQK